MFFSFPMETSKKRVVCHALWRTRPAMSIFYACLPFSSVSRRPALACSMWCSEEAIWKCIEITVQCWAMGHCLECPLGARPSGWRRFVLPGFQDFVGLTPTSLSSAFMHLGTNLFLDQGVGYYVGHKAGWSISCSWVWLCTAILLLSWVVYICKRV